jgi:hypothetical protein
MLDKKLKEALDLLGGKAILKDQEQYYVLLSLKEFKKLRQEGVYGLTTTSLPGNFPRKRKKWTGWQWKK